MNESSKIFIFEGNILFALQSGYMELDNGWITPFNGYQYKISTEKLSWDTGRHVCQGWEGDLIAHGFRDHAARM